MNNNFCFFKLLPLLLALFINVPSFAQISAGGTPPSFRYPTENKILRSAIQLPIDFDITAMRMEDKDREDNKIPPRVGKIIPVYLTTDNSGEWTTLPDGQEIWRLSITAQDAIAIMLTYDKFEIPVGGKLFIYNDDRSRILGAYTEENNPKRVEYATEFVSGDQITLEYAPPFSETSIDTPIIITGVVYGYNYLYTEKMEGGGTRLDFGPSGACMINVICSEGNNWTDQKKGVVRIVTPTGGGYYSLCSGSIVNNTAGDLDPLFLSAFHCYSGLTTNQINQSVYYFHYEHPTCSGRSDPIVPTITGATTLVSLPMNAGSDGYLLRLNEGNPTWFINNGIYFNGWDRRNTAATSGVGIHHPNADVKKISTFTSSLVSSGNINFGEGTTASNSLWRVTWASTTNGHSVTEGGSSGSPIFNQDKRIVGTLTGGSSYCNAPTSPDYYGKLWYHWDQHNTQKMKPYLDPINSNAQFIDGTYTPTGNNYTITATAGTNGTITPSGAVKVASGGSQKFDFTPNSGYEIANVLVNNVSNPGAVTAGFYTFTNVTANHTIHVTFALKPLVCNPPKNLTVSYTTDCKAELTWSAPSKGGVGIPDGEEDDDEGRGISDAAYFTIAGTGAVYKGTVGNVLSGSQIGSAGRDIQCMEYVNGVMYAVSFASGANAFG
ncbi:MAG: hypothetical protein FWF09_03415, partial [Bacteroidales bacterium]|nr:hypothetical protein [Bacteroidales bacterium]